MEAHCRRCDTSTLESTSVHLTQCRCRRRQGSSLLELRCVEWAAASAVRTSGSLSGSSDHGGTASPHPLRLTRTDVEVASRVAPDRRLLQLLRLVPPTLSLSVCVSCYNPPTGSNCTCTGTRLLLSHCAAFAFVGGGAAAPYWENNSHAKWPGGAPRNPIGSSNGLKWATIQCPNGALCLPGPLG